MPTAIQVFDTQGTGHTLSLNFVEGIPTTSTMPLIANLNSTAASVTTTATITDNQDNTHTVDLTLTQNADGSWTPSAQLAAGDTSDATISFGTPPPILLSSRAMPPCPA